LKPVGKQRGFVLSLSKIMENIIAELKEIGIAVLFEPAMSLGFWAKIPGIFDTGDDETKPFGMGWGESKEEAAIALYDHVHNNLPEISKAIGQLALIAI
jgi:hypothetical protein